MLRADASWSPARWRTSGATTVSRSRICSWPARRLEVSDDADLDRRALGVPGTVLRAGFVVTVLALPAVHLGLGWLLGRRVRTAAESAGPSRSRLSTRPACRRRPAGRDVISRRSRGAAHAANGGVDAVFVLGTTTSKAAGCARSACARRLFGSPTPSHAGSGRPPSQARPVSAAVVPAAVAAARGRPGGDVAAYTFDRRGRLIPDPGSPLVMLAGTSGLCFLLSLSIFMSSGLLQQAMSVRAAEPRPRSDPRLKPLDVPHRQGPGPVRRGPPPGRGLPRLRRRPAPATLGMSGFPLRPWRAARVLPAGFVFYACVLAATGALGRDTQESAQIATAWILVGAAPLFLLGSISAAARRRSPT